MNTFQYNIIHDIVCIGYSIEDKPLDLLFDNSTVLIMFLKTKEIHV